MTKYIDADLLREEIKSIEENARKVRVAKESTMNQKIGADGQVHLCQKLNLLIDSLPQEQPEVDLEKEIKDTCRGYRINDYHEQELGKQDIENIARRFFDLGLNARKEESK